MATVYREPNMVKWVGVRPGHNGEQVLIEIDTAVNATLYTVAADKILFLFDWHFGTLPNLSFACNLAIHNDAAVRQVYLVAIGTNAGDMSSESTQALWVPIELAEDWSLRVITSQTVRGYLHGILIDA